MSLHPLLGRTAGKGAQWSLQALASPLNSLESRLFLPPVHSSPAAVAHFCSSASQLGPKKASVAKPRAAKSKALAIPVEESVANPRKRATRAKVLVTEPVKAVKAKPTAKAKVKATPSFRAKKVAAKAVKKFPVAKKPRKATAVKKATTKATTAKEVAAARKTKAKEEDWSRWKKRPSGELPAGGIPMVSTLEYHDIPPFYACYLLRR